MRLSAHQIGTALVILLSTVRAIGACDPTTDPDKADVANARAAIEASCGCATAATHGAYVRCAAHQANATLTNKRCAGAVRTCAARSTCGRRGRATCCRTTAAGRTSCSLKSTAARCVAPKGGRACVGTFSSCCDACGTSGCVVPTTTSTTLVPFCGDGQIDQQREDCDGTAQESVTACAGYACGDPAGPPELACKCCVPPGGVVLYAALPCCDGSASYLAGVSPPTYGCTPAPPFVP